MAKFDRIDGEFVTVHCTHRERLIFKRAGWKFDFRAKVWWTEDEEKAIPLVNYAVGNARVYLDNALIIRQVAVDESKAEDSDEEFPSPEGLTYMPFQKAGIAYAVKRDHTLVADAPGLGKSSCVKTPVLTPNGWVKIGELLVGDQVIGSNGKPTTVTGVYPRGVIDNYTVTFRDGSNVDCGLDHLWTVTNTSWKGKKTRTLSLEQILEQGYTQKSGKSKFKIPLVSPVEFSEKEYYIEPYLMGVLLGDGSLHGSSPTITTQMGDYETIERCKELIKAPYVVKTTDYEKCCARHAITRGKNVGPVVSEYNEELKRLGLRVHGKYKFIPEEYMLGSAEQRLELLRGLMDSDGSCIKNRTTFHSCNKQLAEDVQQLVWSLGGVAILRTYDRSPENKPEEYQVNVKMFAVPFHLQRKCDVWKPANANNAPARFITDIRKNDPCDQVCIAVDADDHLYVTKDYIVTHNTIQAIGVHNVTKAKRILIICPASLKRNWQREWERWDVHGLTTGYTLTRPATKDKPSERVWPDTDVCIVNYDMLDAYDDYIKQVDWDLLICDEAHLLKTKTARRTMCIFGGVKKGDRKKGTKRKEYSPIQAKRHLYLTGTPILSRPIEIWNLIKACDPKGLGKNREQFAFEFCGGYYDAMGFHDEGSSNLDKLNRLMRERFMVRRDKKAVLKELPDKTRELILLPKEKLEAPIKREKNRVEKALSSYESLLGIDSSNAFRYIEDISNKLAKALAEQEGEEPDWDAAVKTLSSPEAIMFTEISEAREEVALAKVGLVVEHVKKLHESDEPVICFGYHKSVIKAIKERLEKEGISVGVITGDVPPDKRQDVVDAFQDGKIDVILGNIIAMGVGLTLTRARFVVFAELDWVPAMIEQAEDRAWRHGQKNAVIVQHLVVDGSIEARMAIALLEKMGVITQALDNYEGLTLEAQYAT